MDARQQHNPKVSPDEWYTPRWIVDTLGPFDLGGLRVRYGKMQETNVYENKEEIPFYQFKG